MLKIATFNVNSLRARYDAVSLWLKESNPDIALLQEIKCQEHDFAEFDFGALGYESVSYGQKSYNGVAILSKGGIEVIQRGLFGGGADEQARFLSVETCGISVASVYCPNGNPVDSEKFSYKLSWMVELENYIRGEVLPSESKWVIGGDYNVCPYDGSAWSVEAMDGDALCRRESIESFRRLVNLGLVDAFNSLHGGERDCYSYWDYQGGAYQKNRGLLIDFLLLSPEASDVLVSSDIESGVRSREKPSDHVPVVCSLEV